MSNSKNKDPIPKISQSRKMANSIKKYLSPEDTHSIMYENSLNISNSSYMDITYQSTENLIKTNNYNLAKLKEGTEGVVKSYIKYILNYYFDTKFDEEVFNNPPKGLYGLYFYFRSKSLKKGFGNLIKDSHIHGIEDSSIKTKKRVDVVNDKFKESFDDNSMMGLKIQILYSLDPYHEVKAVKEESIMKYLNDDEEFKKYIPKFHFGCTIVVPITINNNEKLYVKVRLTFIEHLGEYERLRDYYNHMLIEYKTVNDYEKNNLKLLNIRREYIRNKMKVVRDKVQTIINSLWKLKISHNDFHIGNIMIQTRKITEINTGTNTVNKYENIEDPILKLIDYGNATRIDKNTDITEQSYNQYIQERLIKEKNNNVVLIDRAETELTNVGYLHQITKLINDTFDIK